MKKIHNFNNFLTENKFNKDEKNNIFNLIKSGDQANIELALTLIGDDVETAKEVDSDIILNNFESIVNQFQPEDLSTLVLDKLKCEHFTNFNDIPFNAKNFFKYIKKGREFNGLKFGRYEYRKELSYSDIYISLQIGMIVDEVVEDEDFLVYTPPTGVFEVSIYPTFMIRAGDTSIRRDNSDDFIKLEIEENFDLNEVLPKINTFIDKFNKEISDPKLKTSLIKELEEYKNYEDEDEDY